MSRRADDGTASTPDGCSRTRARSPARTALTLLGLTGIAVAQPIYDLAGRNPEFFVAHRATRADLLLLAAILSLALPLACAALAWLSGLVSRRLGDASVRSLIALLVALFAVQVFKGAGLGAMLPPWGLLILSLGVGGLFAAAWGRWTTLQTFTMILAAGGLVFPATFLLQSSIWKLVSSPADESPEGVWNRSDTPVVLVVFDQLPVTSLLDASGRISRSLYPNFAALADDGTWYRNASAVANKSAWAVPAILTGQYPDPAKRLPSWLDYPDTLFGAMHPHYSMRVEEPVTDLCPREICETTMQRLSVRLRSELVDLGIVFAHVVSPPGWTDRLPPLTDNWRDFGAAGRERLRDRYLEWRQERARWDWTERWVTRRDDDRRRGFRELTEGIGSERQPALYFAHVLLPHEPYEFLPSGRLYRLDRGNRSLQPDGRWGDDPRALREVYQRHLLQVAHVDRLLGRLLEGLESNGLYERALIVVTADHGASFVPGDRFKDPTPTNYADILSVPLIVKLPGRSRGRIDDRNAETVDIVPTIADVLDAEVEWAVDGESLLDADGPARRSKTIYYGAAHGRLSYSLEEVIERRQASLARKISLFGPEGDPLRRGGSVVDRRLVGQPVAQIDRADEGSIVASIHYPHLLAEVDLDSEFLPARVSGTVSGPGTDRFVEDGVELAIALNGVVAATTRSVPDIDSDGASSWAAILPEEAFRQGRNRLGVYVVESTRDGPLLRPAYETEGATTDRDNLILPMPSAQWTSAVEVEGFRRLEWDPEGRPVRWTAPSGTIRVPVDPDDPPAGIDLHVRYVDPRGHRLRLMVNGCTFFSRRVRDAFEERILFAECPVEGSELRLELVSDRFDPEPRPVGVGVSSVVLVDGSDEGT